MIGERIRKMRKAKGLKQRELASLIGVSPNYLSEIEAGKKEPSDPILYLIEDRCAINLDWLVEGKGEMWAEPQIAYERISPSIRKPLEDVREILETGPDDVVSTLEANIKVFLNVTRKAKEKRIYPRVLVTMPVEFQIMDQSENHAGAIMNGSQMGCLIQASHDMAVRTRIHLKVTLPGGPPENGFRATAEIIWKDKPRSDDTETYRYGVRFLEVLDEGHAKLDTLIRESGKNQ